MSKKAKTDKGAGAAQDVEACFEEWWGKNEANFGFEFKDQAMMAKAVAKLAFVSGASSGPVPSDYVAALERVRKNAQKLLDDHRSSALSYLSCNCVRALSASISKSLSLPQEVEVYTKLQDGNWELDGSFTSITLALDRVSKLLNGPLGKSCMYEIHQGGKVIFSHGDLMARFDKHG